MESYKIFSQTLNPSTVPMDSVNNSAKPVSENSIKNHSFFSSEISSEGSVGVLEVFIHHARDIHNICIYHKQDVYAKLYLTSDPDVTVSTKIINGGGRNPVFNDNVRLNVRTVDSSLKCDIWMMSRVKNYMEDQLLGFALVPLSEVVLASGKLAQEFLLSANDLFHSPAGFVQLSLSYVGASPDVMVIGKTPKPTIPDATLPDAEDEDLISGEYEKIEFPDIKVVNENKLMVSEYFGVESTNMESQSSESLITSDNIDCPDEEAGVRIVESFSTACSVDTVETLNKDTPASSLDTVEYFKKDTPVSSVSTTNSPIVLPATSQFVSEPLSAEGTPKSKDKSSEFTEGEADSSAPSESEVIKPIINISVPKETVVQQDFVDMYMKSMQQFTESLAKMKLPLDIETSSPSAENGSSDSGKKSTDSTPKGTGSRVFYGSRAFF